MCGSSVYDLQRRFIGFLERIGPRKEAVPRGHGGVALYNPATFSRTILDFKAILFHSDPLAMYEAFRLPPAPGRGGLTAGGAADGAVRRARRGADPHRA